MSLELSYQNIKKAASQYGLNKRSKYTIAGYSICLYHNNKMTYEQLIEIADLLKLSQKEKEKFNILL